MVIGSFVQTLPYSFLDPYHSAWKDDANGKNDRNSPGLDNGKAIKTGTHVTSDKSDQFHNASSKLIKWFIFFYLRWVYNLKNQVCGWWNDAEGSIKSWKTWERGKGFIQPQENKQTQITPSLGKQGNDAGVFVRIKMCFVLNIFRLIWW